MGVEMETWGKAAEGPRFPPNGTTIACTPTPAPIKPESHFLLCILEPLCQFLILKSGTGMATALPFQGCCEN